MSKSTHASYRAAMDQLRSVERQIRDLKKRVMLATVFPLDGGAAVENPDLTPLLDEVHDWCVVGLRSIWVECTSCAGAFTDDNFAPFIILANKLRAEEDERRRQAADAGTAQIEGQ